MSMSSIQFSLGQEENKWSELINLDDTHNPRWLDAVASAVAVLHFIFLTGQ